MNSSIPEPDESQDRAGAIAENADSIDQPEQSEQYIDQLGHEVKEDGTEHHKVEIHSTITLPELSLAAGDRVCLSIRPPYFKTADPMTMLRPPDTIPVGEEGTILDRRPGGYWAVRFPQGAFLIESQHLRKTS